MTRAKLCRTCYEPLEPGQPPPHCPDCIEYWAEIDRVIRHAKIEESVRKRLKRIANKEIV